MAKKVIVCWSSGKDSALALYELQKDERYEIVSLMSTITQGYERISMHGVRRSLLRRQAASLGIPLQEMSISKDTPNEEYESQMRQTLIKFRDMGVSSVAFGDISLEDVRKYREKNLSGVAMEAIFPLWGRDTRQVIRNFVALGFKAVITCVDSKTMDKKFVGRRIDQHFLEEFPKDADPCGEKGEYHSFVFDGPIFQRRVNYRPGDIVLRENRFYFCDLLPVDEPNAPS